MITDLRMPRLDGIRLIRELRKLHDFASIPLFLLTTETGAGNKKAGRKAGASGWIEKPVAADRLLALVSEVLGYEGGRIDTAANSRLKMARRGSEKTAEIVYTLRL